MNRKDERGGGGQKEADCYVLLSATICAVLGPVTSRQDGRNISCG